MIIGVVFARGGSKGVPGKNLRTVGGKSLLTRAIQTASSVPEIDLVVVSTDSSEIACEARTAGAEVPFVRPAELATDDAPEWLAWRHAITALSETTGSALEAMVSVPCTAPLRRPADVSACVSEFRDNACDAVITVTEARHHPSFNMVRLEEGLVSLAYRQPVAVNRRQDAPALFDMCTVAYVVSPKHVQRSQNLLDGNVRAVVIPSERSLDIDTEFDLEVADLVLSAREGVAT